MAKNRLMVLSGAAIPGILGRSGPSDTIAPTVVLSSAAAATVYAAFSVTATFSEDVTGFVVGDITVTNGSAGTFVAVSDSVYTFTVTPTAAGTVTVAIGAGVCTDAAGNANTAATNLTREYATIDSIIAGWSPIIDHRFNEASGAVINYGSLGVAGDGTNSGCTVGQAGAQAANEAYLWSAGNYVQIADNAAFNLGAGFSVVQLVKPSGLGDSNIGRFFSLDAGSRAWFNSALNAIRFVVNGSTDSNTVGTFVSNIPTTTWSWLFFIFDGSLGYVYRSNGTALEQLSYTTQTAITTFTNPNANPRWGQATEATNRTFAGVMDRCVLTAAVLEESEMSALISASPFLG